jgi:pentatricopeptide repeat protein
MSFFKDMRRRGIKADVLTYNALITALGNGGKKERALQVYLKASYTCGLVAQGLIH